MNSSKLFANNIRINFKLLDTKLKIILICFSFLFVQIGYSQIPLTDEIIYLYSLKQGLKSNPNDQNGILNKEINSYPVHFDNQNYQRSRQNEFARNEYDNKTIIKLKAKIQQLSYKTVYYFGGNEEFSEYNFNDKSFTTDGSKPFKLRRFTNVVDKVFNTNFYMPVKFFITPEKGKALIDSKTNMQGKTERTVYKVVYFNFMDRINDLTIFVHKIELYADQSMNQNLVTILFDLKNTDPVTGNPKNNDEQNTTTRKESKDGWFRAQSDMWDYKIISKGKGHLFEDGNYIQLVADILYKGSKDTLIEYSKETMPSISKLSHENGTFYEIFKQARSQDSIIIKSIVKEYFKNNMPSFMQKDKSVYVFFKVKNIFTTAEQVDSASNAEYAIWKPKQYLKQLEQAKIRISKNKKQIENDGQKIVKYLENKKITATKTEWGNYIVVHDKGSEEKITINDIVSVNYTGWTLADGKIFDSNTDPAFEHVEPLKVSSDDFSILTLGLIDALHKLNKGSKATVYVPSALAYGIEGNTKVLPNSIVVFDIEIF